MLGQNVTSRAFGHCPKAIFSGEVSTSPIPFQPREGIQPTRKAPPKPSTGPVVIQRPNENSSNSNISRPPISSPIRHSFIHAGHGGSDTTWGDPSSIPEVYLKNPVLKPVVGTDINDAFSLSNQPESIPMKPSIPSQSSSGVNTSRSNNSGGSSGFGSGNDENFASIEAWHRSRFNHSGKSK